MRKDFIYQDTTGQYKLLQNAERIGGFYAGDGGIVPAERVLPEQRFAHQPIFRRPPEEVQEMTYIPYRGSGGQVYPGLVKFGIEDGLDVIKFHIYWGHNDSGFQRKFVLRHRNPSHPWIVDKEFVQIGGGGAQPAAMSAIWKNEHFWQLDQYSADGGGVGYGRLTTAKNGRVYVDNFHTVIPPKEGNHQWLQIYWVYKDNEGNFRILIYEDDNNIDWPKGHWLREYSAPKPEGPWTATGNNYNVGLLMWNYWNVTFDITPLDVLVKELATFILSKSHSELEFGFTGSLSISVIPFRMDWIHRQAFGPPWFLPSDPPGNETLGSPTVYDLRWKNKDIITFYREDFDPPNTYFPRAIIRHGDGTFTEKVYDDSIWWYDHPA